MKVYTKLWWLPAMMFVALNIGFGQSPRMLSILGFEDTLPSFWTLGNHPAGVTLSWATDSAHSGIRSLKIVKTSTTDSASWISQNMCDNWSYKNAPNRDIIVGVAYKTQGVNVTSATSGDSIWYVSYTFYDTTGALILETKLPLNQSVATSAGWIVDTSQSGQTTLDRASFKTIVKFVAGKAATGTVWADDFTLYDISTSGPGWGGQDWNTDVEFPTGWFYYFPPIGGNDGRVNQGFENTIVTTAQSHSGTHSLKFSLPASHKNNDGFVGLKRVPFDSIAANIKPDTTIVISVWIKADSLVPDSAAAHQGSWSVGFSVGFDSTVNNNSPYDGNMIFQGDSTFVFPHVTSFDWTKFSMKLKVPRDTANGVTPKAIEIRLHVYSLFVGTVYFDDLSVSVGGTTGVQETGGGLPQTFALSNNYPNPFNPSTRISFALPQASRVSLKVYNVLGQEVRTLVDAALSAGTHEVTWDGKDSRGFSMQSGVYFVRMESGSTQLTRKMLLMK